MSHLFSSDRLRGTRVLLLAQGEERELASNFLTMVGANVVAAEALDEAWAEFERGAPPSIVVCALPDAGRALKFIGAIRVLPAERGGLTPAVAVSECDGQALLMHGYHVHLSAPADPIRLIEIVDDFAHSGVLDRYVEAQWTVRAPRPGLLILTLSGQVQASDVHALTRAIVERLEQGPCELIVDVREITGFAPSAASVAERNVWATRKAVRSVAMVGGSLASRIATRAACKLLSIPCTLHDEMPSAH
jgi:hypothetical protein